MKLIERKAYLDQLQAVKGIPDIKVITGIRRSGKSRLMDAFIDSFPEDEQTSIIRIKLNLKSFERLREADKLYSYIPGCPDHKKQTDSEDISWIPELYREQAA